MAGELRAILENAKAPPGTEADKSMGVMEAAWEGLKETKQAFAPGLTLANILADVGPELTRLGVQGSAELAAAIFGAGNSAYVPYGRGQSPLGKEGVHGQEEQKPEQQQEQSRGGREM